MTGRRIFAVSLLFAVLVSKLLWGFFPVQLYRDELGAYLPFFWGFGVQQIDRQASSFLAAEIAKTGTSATPPIRPTRGKLNVIVVTVESLRSDALDPLTAPFLDSLSRANVSFRDHYSTGNCTPFAVASVLDGSWPSSYFKMGKAHCFAAFPGYRFVTGNPIGWGYWHQDSGLFRGFENLLPDYQGDAGFRGDSLLLDTLGKVLNGSKVPVFASVMLNATHFKYSVDSSDVVYKDYWNQGLDLMNLDAATIATIRHRYQNSVRTVDRNLRRFLGELSRKGILEHSVVVITGDHGEEFFERGHLSHTSDANPFQVRVPLILIDRGRHGEVAWPTSHVDILPMLARLSDSTSLLPDCLPAPRKASFAFLATPIPAPPTHFTAWVGKNEYRLLYVHGSAKVERRPSGPLNQDDLRVIAQEGMRAGIFAPPSQR